MSSITSLATISGLIAVENKVPDISNLVKETNYDAEISDIEPNILLWLITISCIKHLMQKGKRKN